MTKEYNNTKLFRGHDYVICPETKRLVKKTEYVPPKQKRRAKLVRKLDAPKRGGIFRSKDHMIISLLN